MRNMHCTLALIFSSKYRTILSAITRPVLAFSACPSMSLLNSYCAFLFSAKLVVILQSILSLVNSTILPYFRLFEFSLVVIDYFAPFLAVSVYLVAQLLQFPSRYIALLLIRQQQRLLHIFLFLFFLLVSTDILALRIVGVQDIALIV